MDQRAIKEPAAGNECCWTMQWGNVRGLEWGNSQSTRKVLMVHGWLDNCHSFVHMGPALANSGFHAVALDLPGMGRSDSFPPGLHCHDLELVSVLHKLLRILCWNSCVLVGHSMGGGLCLLLTAALPQQVEALVMLDISYLPLRPGTPTEVVPRLRGALLRSSAMSSKQCGGGGEERGRVYPDKEAAVERLLQPPGYMRGRPVEAILVREGAEQLVERGTSPLEDATGLVFSRDRRWTLPLLDPLSWEDQLSLTEEVTCPHLIIEAEHGPKDALWPTMVAGYKDRNPLFEHQVVEGLHHAHLNTPDLINLKVVNFLDKHSPAPKHKL